MKTFYIKAIPVLFLAFPIFLFQTGCSTAGGGSGGWIVIDSPANTSPPQHRAPPGDARGLDVAAKNHIRSAYRFLQKDKPDHAYRELEKARAKMGQDYWFHYYMGGVFYLKALYGEAAGSWEKAYQLTKEPQLRSRIMTCRSFAEYMVGGEDRSAGYLGKAIDLDSNNLSAREFLDDLKMGPSVEKTGRNGKGLKKVKPAKGQPDDNKGKSPKQGKKIQDREQFKAYFLVEMPNI